ncbi:FAD-dependent oxidoreductase [Pseudooceanicola nanhaiensis]|uniref:FAD-dependent oxidoreductase n=1 Tax=Pseudooceanicola nanhaiensis TaxID=375761 RepID=UPI001CD21E6A|nr:FAD-dependent oxidoreductase [Pseudooceanicola nanhaiensis]MCA0920202.1 sulfide dehydrogenase [Pseudooceanicola nanhaiensis]
MHRLTRRHLLGLAAGAAGAAALGLTARPRGTRALVVGGGPAGASHALRLALRDPATSVVLVERDPTRLARAAAPVFGQPTAGPSLATLQAAGVEIVLDEVTGIDWRGQSAALFSGRALAFDRILLAPGTAPLPEAMAGLDAAARHRWPAAWGSPREARRLAATLEALPDAPHVALRLPEKGLAHPEAALTRALDLAQWLARHRPAARFTVLDGGAATALAPRFEAARPRALATAWLVPGTGGRVTAIDAQRGRIETDAGRLAVDAVNFLPPLGAGRIAALAGLTDASHWCPTDAAGCSALQPAAMILGDARAEAPRTLAGALRLSAPV